MASTLCELVAAVEPHYELRTNVPVGETPRSADIVLLRRVSRGALPFRGIWRFLTPWNVVEFKGASVSPRNRDIDRLIELGLGIDRRLNEERAQQNLKNLDRGDVSFWYIANQLGRRFLRLAKELIPGLVPVGPAVWQGKVAGRLVYLVSGSKLPVEDEAVPVHLASSEGRDTEVAVARLIVEKDQLWKEYGGWLATLHPAILREVEAMAQKMRRKIEVDFGPVIERYGIAAVIGPHNMDRLIAEIGIERIVNEVGLDRLIEQVGLDRLIENIGEKVLMDRLVRKLSPANKRKLKRLLESSAE